MIDVIFKESAVAAAAVLANKATRMVAGVANENKFLFPYTGNSTECCISYHEIASLPAATATCSNRHPNAPPIRNQVLGTEGCIPIDTEAVPRAPWPCRSSGQARLWLSSCNQGAPRDCTNFGGVSE